MSLYSFSLQSYVLQLPHEAQLLKYGRLNVIFSVLKVINSEMSFLVFVTRCYVNIRIEKHIFCINKKSNKFWGAQTNL